MVSRGNHRHYLDLHPVQQQATMQNLKAFIKDTICLDEEFQSQAYARMKNPLFGTFHGKSLQLDQVQGKHCLSFKVA